MTSLLRISAPTRSHTVPGQSPALAVDALEQASRSCRNVSLAGTAFGGVFLARWGCPYHVEDAAGFRESLLAPFPEVFQEKVLLVAGASGPTSKTQPTKSPAKNVHPDITWPAAKVSVLIEAFWGDAALPLRRICPNPHHETKKTTTHRNSWSRPPLEGRSTPACAMSGIQMGAKGRQGLGGGRVGAQRLWAVQCVPQEDESMDTQRRLTGIRSEAFCMYVRRKLRRCPGRCQPSCVFY